MSGHIPAVLSELHLWDAAFADCDWCEGPCASGGADTLHESETSGLISLVGTCANAPGWREGEMSPRPEEGGGGVKKKKKKKVRGIRCDAMVFQD